MPKIDNAEYEHGRDMFAAGGTFRQLVEPLLEDTRPDADTRAASRVLGFFDGLLQKIDEATDRLAKFEDRIDLLVSKT